MEEEYLDTYMKVDTSAIYRLQGELSEVLNRAYYAVSLMAEGIGKTDNYLVCQGVYKIKQKSVNAMNKANKAFSKMNQHIIKLAVIAEEYERAERDNKDGID